MTLITAIFASVLLANAAWAARFAFTTSRDQNDGGYPIFGHALAAFFIVLCWLMLLPRLGEPPIIFRIAIACLLFVAPVATILVIIVSMKLGRQAREAP